MSLQGIRDQARQQLSVNVPEPQHMYGRPDSRNRFLLPDLSSPDGFDEETMPLSMVFENDSDQFMQTKNFVRDM